MADLIAVGPAIHSALLTGSTAAQLPLAIHLAFEDRWTWPASSFPHRRAEVRCS